MPRRAHYDRFAIDQLVGLRDGVVTRRELLALGMPSASVQARTGTGGPWQRLMPGVVLTYSGTPTLQQRSQGALAYAGQGAMLTGICALARMGVRNVPDSRELHVLITHGRRRVSTDSVIVERSRRLPRPRKVDGLPCAPIARACIDAARRMRDLRSVRALIAEVVQRGMASVKQLAREIRDAQIRGTALPRGVIREVSAGIRSIAEAEVRDTLRSAGIPEPAWNLDLYDKSGKWLARPDGTWLEVGVVLEIDSLEWHLSPAAYRHTQERHRRMTAAGLLVIHVTPGTVRHETERFLADVRATLAAGAARSAPQLLLRPAA